MAIGGLNSLRWVHIVQWFDGHYRRWHQRRFASDTDARKFGERLEREGGQWVHVHSIRRREMQPRLCQVTWREGHKCSGPLLTTIPSARRKLILT
jgi:hypothetical protein